MAKNNFSFEKRRKELEKKNKKEEKKKRKLENAANPDGEASDTEETSLEGKSAAVAPAEPQ